jgi:hypothetical protein
VICNPCKAAGKYATSGNPGGAKLLHDDCKAPTTCACQHETVSVKEQGKANPG